MVLTLELIRNRIEHREDIEDTREGISWSMMDSLRHNIGTTPNIKVSRLRHPHSGLHPRWCIQYSHPFLVRIEQ
jgi:hypothetical protein